MNYELDDLLSIGDSIATLSKADETEAYVSAGERIMVLCDGFTTETMVDEWLGIGVRCVVDGKVGFASTNNASDTERLKMCVETAVDIAQHKPLDENFVSLPSPQHSSSVGGDYDEVIASMDVKTIAESVQFRKKEIGHIIARSCTFGISNSNGIEIGDRYTQMKIYKENIESCDLNILRSRKYFTDALIDEEQTKSLKPTVSAQGTLENSVQSDVLFTDRVSHFLIEPLTYHLSAGTVQSGKSRFTGGEEIASDNFTLIDDGQLEGGINTYVCDGEGIPMSKTSLVERGIVKNFMYDTYSAYRDNKESTGNGIRISYANTPYLYHTNFFIPSTKKDISDEIENAFVISRVMGGFTADTYTGDFSVVSQTPLRISSGEVQRYSPITIKGNLFTLLQNIIEIGEPRRLTEVGSIPSLWVRDLTVVP